MIRRGSVQRLVVTASCVAVTVTGCSFGGLNSLPLPGTVGHGKGATTYHIEIANVGQLESNSPVMVGDVVVGSVGDMTVTDWHADVEVSVQPGVVIPANAVASVGQTSLLGSMHLALNPPLGQAPTGVLQPGATLGLNRSSTYPSTEQTLSALSVVVNGGGLGQIGDIIHEFSTALNGRTDQIRDLLTRLNDFVGLLATQRDSINEAVNSLNRLAGTFAAQQGVLTDALNRIPPALDVLIKERPRITTALEKFRDFSNLATGLVNDTKADLVRNLQNLEPTLKSLADVGPKLDTALAYLPTFPYTQQVIDRAIRGDYLNQFIIFDFTVPRLKKTLMLGTRWGDENAKLVPAPGDPWYATYTYDPLHAPFSPAPPPTQVADLPQQFGPGPAPVPGQASLTNATLPAPATDAIPLPGTGSGPLPGPAPEAAPQDGGN
ncbi:mammalian cell entry protein [Mycobacterium sp. ENV421]|uniref:MCE family protein n=1 Tax=unclassified Mycobacterium TaxID=2642494 RepID=UPI000C9A9544|nr:MCE family protein [Mycobacterium sp. ENV421]PND55448.1 mammalian cell entry protein [Mycobacterium sp. ENV421]